MSLKRKETVIKDPFTAIIGHSLNYFKIIGNKLYIDEELASKDKTLKYRDDALKLLNSNLWKMITMKITYKSEESMFKKSKHVDDLFFGKAMIYNISLFNGYLKKLSNIK